MKRVDFVIVGFMKSGTTALADFLSQHPEICMSIPKEPGYFSTDFIDESDEFHGKKVYFKTRTPEQYDNLFTHGQHGQKLGEASTAYIYSKVAAKNIHEHNPNAKIIIMIRNPADFLHSLHMQYVNETVEDEPDFEKALSLEKERKKGNKIPPRVRVPSYLYYTDRIKYHQQIKRYFDVFPKKQILVMTQDDLLRDNVKAYKKITRFIGVDDSFKPNFKTVHGSKKPRFKWLHTVVNYPPFKNILYKFMGGQLYTKTHKNLSSLIMKQAPREMLNSNTRKRLNHLAKNDVQNLSHLLKIDLEKEWLSEEDEK